jgi:hypothetical protein
LVSSGCISFKEIREMLDACAPGARIVPKKHRNWVLYNGKTYRNLPLGEHGARKNPEIEIGHVRKLARHFEILPCAKSHIPNL